MAVAAVLAAALAGAVVPVSGVSGEPGATRDGAADLGDITGLVKPRFPKYDLDLDGGDSVHWFVFSLSERRKVNIGLRQLDADADMFLEDSAGTVLGESRKAGTANEKIQLDLDAGTYYIRVRAQASGPNRYALRHGTADPTTEPDPPPAPEPETSADPPEVEKKVAVRESGGDDYSADATTGGVVVPGGAVTGEVEAPGDVDWFAVDLLPGRRYEFWLRGADDGEGTLVDPLISGIHDSAGAMISGTRNDNMIGSVTRSYVAFTPDAAGVYFVAAGGSNGATGTYELSAVLVRDDFWAWTDTAGEVAVGGSTQGALDYTFSDVDWIKVELLVGNRYQIDVQGSNSSGPVGTLADPKVQLHDDAGQRIRGASNDNGGPGRNARLKYTADRTGTYFIAVSGRGLRGTYTVSVTDLTSAERASDTNPGLSFEGVAAGGSFSCVLGDDGRARCWGSPFRGRTEPPAQAFAAIDAGYRHGCGLGGDGAVVCWGDSLYNRLGAPAGQYSQVSAGGLRSCALSVAGKVLCWGLTLDAPPQPVAGKFRSVSAGYLHACAITEAGLLSCWAESAHDFGAVDGETNPPAGQHTAVSSGHRFSCAIDEAQALACWGLNDHGQTDSPAGRFTAVAAGFDTACAIDIFGALACWGDQRQGIGSPPPGVFREVSVGTNHACALASDATVACWGSNRHRQADAPHNHNGTLRVLKISGADLGEPGPDGVTYTKRVPNSLDRTTIEIEPWDTDAEITVTPPDADPHTDGHQVDLDVGDNTITVTITLPAPAAVAQQTAESTPAPKTVHNRQPRGTPTANALATARAGRVVGSDVALKSSSGPYFPAPEKILLKGCRRVGTALVCVCVINVHREPEPVSDPDLARRVSKLDIEPSGGSRSFTSDGTHFWASPAYGDFKGTLSRYDFAPGAQDPNGTLVTGAPFVFWSPTGMWTDGATLWASLQLNYQEGTNRYEIRAFDLATGRPDRDKDIRWLAEHGIEYPGGIWSDGETMWVSGGMRIFAFDIDTGERLLDREFAIPKHHWYIRGIWSDGETMWGVSYGQSRVYAYDLDTGSHLRSLDFDVVRGAPWNIWSDGETAWVSNHGRGVLAYALPQRSVLMSLPHLTSLKLNDESVPGFHSERESYRMTVPSTTTSMTVAIAAEHALFATISPADSDSDSSNGYQVALSEGENTITVELEYLNVSRRYTVEVYRHNAATLGSDSTLSALTLSDLSFTFASGTHTYYIDAPSALETTTVTATAALTTTSVRIKPADADTADDAHDIDLAAGFNTVKVIATAQDGSVTKYTLIIGRGVTASLHPHRVRAEYLHKYRSYSDPDPYFSKKKSSRLTISDGFDYRYFKLPSRRTLGLGVRNFDVDLDLYLEDGAGNVLASSTVTGADGADSDNWEWINTTLEPGLYYIRVQTKDPGETAATDYVLRYGPP